jgi:hypothetical protein
VCMHNFPIPEWRILIGFKYKDISHTSLLLVALVLYSIVICFVISDHFVTSLV